MHGHIKKLLNISGKNKRYNNLPLGSVGKVCGNTLILRLVYPSIGTLQPFDTLTTSQKLMLKLQQYAFISFSIPIR